MAQVPKLENLTNSYSLNTKQPNYKFVYLIMEQKLPAIYCKHLFTYS